MIIISDTSPLSALAEIDALDLLRQLYGRVCITETVLRECLHPHCPLGVAAAIQAVDSFIDVVSDPVLLPETASLDPGEASAISLAWLHQTEATLIVDDRDGRSLCDALGLKKTGTLGVLFEAARRGLVDFADTTARLKGTSFRISQATIEELKSRL